MNFSASLWPLTPSSTYCKYNIHKAEPLCALDSVSQSSTKLNFKTKHPDLQTACNSLLALSGVRKLCGHNYFSKDWGKCLFLVSLNSKSSVTPISDSNICRFRSFIGEWGGNYPVTKSKYWRKKTRNGIIGGLLWGTMWDKVETVCFQGQHWT